jgi:hypothetical protein
LKPYYLLIVFLFFTPVSILRLLFLQSKRLTKELKSINWKEVDEYPSVVGVKKSKIKTTSKVFFEVLTPIDSGEIECRYLSILFILNWILIEVKVTIFSKCNDAV